jgi:hypothetical protein
MIREKVNICWAPTTAKSKPKKNPQARRASVRLLGSSVRLSGSSVRLPAQDLKPALDFRLVVGITT